MWKYLDPQVKPFVSRGRFTSRQASFYDFWRVSLSRTTNSKKGDAIFIGMNSQQARDKAINLMNEEGKEVTVEFLMNHLAVEDGNTQHRLLSQLDSSSSVNMIAYDRRQNRGKSNRSKNSSGKEREQNKTRVQTSSSTAQPSRKPPGMEGQCMRCGKPEH